MRSAPGVTGVRFRCRRCGSLLGGSGGGRERGAPCPAGRPAEAIRRERLRRQCEGLRRQAGPPWAIRVYRPGLIGHIVQGNPRTANRPDPGLENQTWHARALPPQPGPRGLGGRRVGQGSTPASACLLRSLGVQLRMYRAIVPVRDAPARPRRYGWNGSSGKAERRISSSASRSKNWNSARSNQSACELITSPRLMPRAESPRVSCAFAR